MNKLPGVFDRNIAIVCNPFAGGGKALEVTQVIMKQLEAGKMSFTVFQNNWPDDLIGFTEAWIVGGDGTLNFFINRYPGIKIPFAIFKGGTGNDFHSLLYGKRSLEEQLELVLTVAAKPVDAGRCNENLFINGVGIGFEGAVAESVLGKKKKSGKTSFMIAVLRKILFYRSRFYSIQSTELKSEQKSLMISVCNGRWAGGGFQVAPLAQADDGWLDVVIIKAISPLLRIRWLPVIDRGKHLRLSFVSHFKIRKIIVESNQIIQSHLDGEVYQNKRLEIEILPGKYLIYH
ncbi:MAG: hypothetical protein JST10_04690 [Bacteroidetes bacterium]|nr:hypothetical protein [Bacteroidota bacterium]MBS1631851.1 hypothetical protein [Bacteroidota bacterium]